MGDLWNDVKHALHMFIKSPGVTVAAVAALALGIGANTAIFTVVNAVLLKVHGIHVTEAYFRVFGAPVMLGRTFTQQEDLPNGGKVVVLSYGFWQRKFGGNPNVIGSALPLGNEPYTIVGVLGKDFHTDPQVDILLPFQFAPVSTNHGHFFLTAAMLKPGVTMEQANAQMKLAGAKYNREYPDSNPQMSFGVQPLRDSIVGDVRQLLLVLLGAVGMVLLIACANVANLLLVRRWGRAARESCGSCLPRACCWR